MRVYTLYLTNDLNANYFGTMNDITAIFQHYVETCRSIDIAESEFMKAIHEDSGLRTAYREWCHEYGSTEREGFSDWCEEYLDTQNDVWNNLNDFDEQY